MCWWVPAAGWVGMKRRELRQAVLLVCAPVSTAAPGGPEKWIKGPAALGYCYLTSGAWCNRGPALGREQEVTKWTAPLLTLASGRGVALGNGATGHPDEWI